MRLTQPLQSLEVHLLKGCRRAQVFSPADREIVEYERVRSVGRVASASERRLRRIQYDVESRERIGPLHLDRFDVGFERRENELDGGGSALDGVRKLRAGVARE